MLSTAAGTGVDAAPSGTTAPIAAAAAAAAAAESQAAASMLDGHSADTAQAEGASRAEPAGCTGSSMSDDIWPVP